MKSKVQKVAQSRNSKMSFWVCKDIRSLLFSESCPSFLNFLIISRSISMALFCKSLMVPEVWRTLNEHLFLFRLVMKKRQVQAFL